MLDVDLYGPMLFNTGIIKKGLSLLDSLLSESYLT